MQSSEGGLPQRDRGRIVTCPQKTAETAGYSVSMNAATIGKNTASFGLRRRPKARDLQIQVAFWEIVPIPTYIYRLTSSRGTPW